MGMIASLLIGAAAIGGMAYSMSKMNKPVATPQLLPMPAAPKVEDEAKKAQAAADEKRRAMARSKSIFTSPLGIGGEAAITKKVLLGQ